mmetsp:Transcript_35759/g.26559  ORF Transcript_35759/g.26559 Transcript_35759/m.26559 type:complete len:131 (+) Transcript_35759:375-767(+)
MKTVEDLLFRALDYFNTLLSEKGRTSYFSLNTYELHQYQVFFSKKSGHPKTDYPKIRHELALGSLMESLTVIVPKSALILKYGRLDRATLTRLKMLDTQSSKASNYSTLPISLKRKFKDQDQLTTDGYED